MSSASEWSRALWAHYQPIILKGRPLHLAPDETLIHSLAQKHEMEGATPSESVDRFHAACREAFILVPKTAPTSAVLLKNAMMPSDDGFSVAICLAVQQSLIVEEMVAGEGIGAGAYFPRYRTRLGLVDHASQNPIAEKGFARIWETLRDEIESQPGATASTATFAPGSGIDRNRNFPFSQALLTHTDLSRFHTRLTREITDASDDLILRELFQLSAQLSRRGKRLAATSNPWVRVRLCEQIRAFHEAESSEQSESPAVRQVSTAKFVAYLRNDDPFAENDSFDVLLDDNGRHVSGDRARDAVIQQVSTAGRALLVEDGDIYRSAGGDGVRVGDPLLIIFRAAGLEAANTRNPFGGSFAAVEVDLGGDLAAVLTRSLRQAEADILTGGDIHASPPHLSLVGGLRPDDRTPQFLEGYPPMSLSLSGKIVPRESEIEVDGEVFRSGEFFGSLENTRGFMSYTIGFEGKTVQFAILSPSVPSHRGDLRFRHDGRELAPTADENSADFPGLSGTLLWVDMESPEQVDPITLIELSLLLDRGRRIRVSRSDVELLVSSLDASPNQHPAMRVVRSQIDRSTSIPVAAFEVLRSRRAESS